MAFSRRHSVPWAPNEVSAAMIPDPCPLCYELEPWQMVRHDREECNRMELDDLGLAAYPI